MGSGRIRVDGEWEDKGGHLSVHPSSLRVFSASSNDLVVFWAAETRRDENTSRSSTSLLPFHLSLLLLLLLLRSTQQGHSDHKFSGCQ